jgi:hypothetical protein
MGHRIRWAIAWSLLALWLASLILGLGGGGANVLLVAAIAVLFYELLVVDRTPPS